MEVTINYNGQAVTVGVTLESMNFLTGSITKRRTCSMNSDGIGARVRAMLVRCYGPTGMKKRPDSRKLFERKNSNIHLQNDNFRTGYQTGPVR